MLVGWGKTLIITSISETYELSLGDFFGVVGMNGIFKLPGEWMLGMTMRKGEKSEFPGVKILLYCGEINEVY
ncbi:MAG: hypothetical protein N3D76_05660 [Geminocystis sp.]|nr:hypothetical protein [Geminocystis sp.]